jgi:hypothetical protein
MPTRISRSRRIPDANPSLLHCEGHGRMASSTYHGKSPCPGMAFFVSADASLNTSGAFAAPRSGAKPIDSPIQPQTPHRQKRRSPRPASRRCVSPRDPFHPQGQSRDLWTSRRRCRVSSVSSGRSPSAQERPSRHIALAAGSRSGRRDQAPVRIGCRTAPATRTRRRHFPRKES